MCVCVCVCEGGITEHRGRAGDCGLVARALVCVCVCVSIGLTEHTDRGLARVGLTNQDRTKQAYRGRKALRQAGSMCVCVCVCVCVCDSRFQQGVGCVL